MRAQSHSAVLSARSEEIGHNVGTTAHVIVRIVLLLSAAALLISCGKGGSVTGPQPHVEQPVAAAPDVRPPFSFGYFWTVGDQPSPGMGDYLDEAPAWSNLIYVSVPTWPLDRVEELAERASRRHLWVVYSVVDEMQGTGKPAPDSALDGIWAQQLPKVRAFAKRGVLHSVYILDEPVANAVPVAHQQKIAALVKNAGFRTMIVENGTQHVPVDYFGISCYAHIGTPGGNAGCRQSYYHSDANIIVFPGFYSEGYQDGHRDAVGFARWDQDAWGDLARELRGQGRLDGVLVFLWPSLPGMVGTRDDPEFQEQHRRAAASLGVSR